MSFIKTYVPDSLSFAARFALGAGVCLVAAAAERPQVFSIVATAIGVGRDVVDVSSRRATEAASGLFL